MQKILGVLLGFAAMLPAAFFSLLALSTPLSPSGRIYLLGLWVFALGALLSPWRPALSVWVAGAGLAAMLGTATVRVLALGGNSAPARLVVLPAGRPPRLLSRLFDEQDIALFGERVAIRLGMISQGESEGLIATLHSHYQEMRRTDGDLPTPVLNTYLGLQRPGSFDALVFDAPEQKGALIFLHGFTGNFAVQCYLVAEAARQAGLATVCPSVGYVGDWWQPPGEATLRATIQELQAQGITAIYLAGLSNGAIGAARLAPQFAPDLRGLILISGAPGSRGDLQGLPALVLHGSRDDRFPPAYVRAFAQRQGAEYVEFDSDHFLLARQAEEVQAALTAWLQRRLAASTPPP